jgi:hypothetical protein
MCGHISEACVLGNIRRVLAVAEVQQTKPQTPSSGPHQSPQLNHHLHSISMISTRSGLRMLPSSSPSNHLFLLALK